MSHITVEFYEEGKHPRGKDGRWGPSGGGPSPAVTPSVVRRETVAHGGMTMRRLTGEVPKTGFVVSEFPQHSLVLGLDDLNREPGRVKLKSWLRSKAKILDQPENFMGSWHDVDGGNAYMDIVRVFPAGQRAQAIEAGRKANQIAIWDLGESTEIDTGGTGKAAAIVTAMASKADRPQRRGYIMKTTGDVDADADLLIGAILADVAADKAAKAKAAE